MHLSQILTPDRTLAGVTGESKKRLLEFFSTFITQKFPELDSEEVFEQLLAREKLGSTGIGEGVALPHCRISSTEQAIGTFIRLKDRIDFDALDSQPVDLIFLLLVPENANEEHLQALALLAGRFSEESFRQQLRKTNEPEQLYQLIVN